MACDVEGKAGRPVRFPLAISTSRGADRALVVAPEIELMRISRHVRNRFLQFEPLEGRALMSAVGKSAKQHAAIAAVLDRSDARRVAFSSIGESAVLDAVFGGAGHEFVTLALREVHDIGAVVTGFETGRLSALSVPGLTFKSPPNLQPLYGYAPHDPLALNVAGAVLLKRQTIELAAIVRGPFTTYPGTTYIVFAINRGAGGRLGPAFASRPGITPDALVTVEVGPYGRSNSATITDLTTGATQSISPSLISVAGPTVRLLVSANQLPSEGFPVKKYTFAAWTEIQPNATISEVGSFIPEDSMVPIGVETNVNPPRI
jgi:hypothetical protein